KWERIVRADVRRGHSVYYGDNYNSSRAPITYFLNSKPEGEATLEISDLKGRTFTANVENEPGIHRYMWNMQFESPQAEQPPPGGIRGRGSRGVFAGYGEYLVKLTAGGETYTKSIIIRQDPLLSGK
ncbi:hypothetical protein ACFL7D_11485, partial [candidate division KSB1 bacterium]